MISSNKDKPARLLTRKAVQLLIILAVATTLGLTFNTFNPDGIPLVKKRPVLHGK